MSSRFRFRWILVVVIILLTLSAYEDLLVRFERQRSTYSMYWASGLAPQPQSIQQQDNTSAQAVQSNTTASTNAISASVVQQVETEKRIHSTNPSQHQHHHHRKPDKRSSVNRFKPTVFYNIYVVPKNFGKVKRIAQEQLQQLGLSYAASSGSDKNDSLMQVMYTTIGYPVNHTIVGVIQKICSENRLQCQHLGHHLKGFEMITLQSMLDYCQQNPSRRVIYLHPKGSFHDFFAYSQDTWRQDLTRAAASQNCTEPPDSECNVCGLDFQPTWGPIVMGTMFQSPCSYVRKLVSPLDLGSINQKAYEARPANMTAKLYDFLPYSGGYNRFAAEAYIGTHPEVVGCDGSGSSRPKKVWPTHDFTAKTELLDGYSNGSIAHAREWFLLGGLLWRHYYIYNSTPPVSSWVWWYFPDGAKWQSAVEKHGMPEAVYRASRDNRIPA